MALNTISVTPKKLDNILLQAYECRMPVFLWGDPGIGKSDSIREFCKKNVMKLIDLRLTTMESSDLRGLMWIDDKEKITRWYRPEFMPTEDVPGVIFLDELTAAEQRMQASSYELVLDRRIGPHAIPDKWWVCAAGNIPNTGSISYKMGAALADRFCHIKLEADVDDWIAWARKSEIDPSVIAFLKVKPEYLTSVQGQKQTDQVIVPSPRSWARASKIIKSNGDESTKIALLSGLIGDGPTTEFMHVAREISSLPPIEELLAMPVKKAAKAIPNSVTALYGLTYSTVAYARTIQHMEKITAIFEEICNDKTKIKLPKEEIQSLAMELLLEKAYNIKILDELVTTKAFKEYIPKCKEITEVK